MLLMFRQQTVKCPSAFGLNSSIWNDPINGLQLYKTVPVSYDNTAVLVTQY